MPYNGAGGFAPPAGAPYPAVGGTTILASQFNTIINDLCNQGLANCVTRDGQSPALASLPMGGFKHTNVALAVAATEYARYDQLQSGSAIWCGNATGTANAINISPAPAITAYVAGQSFLFKATATNNAATTIQINGVASPPAAQNNGAALVGGEIINGRWYRVTLTSATTCEVEELSGGTAFTDTLTNKTLTAPTISAPVITGTASGGTFTGSTFTNPANTGQALTDAATITWDASLGGVATVTITATRAMATPTNLKVGGRYVLHVTQNATGGWGLTFSAAYKNQGGSAVLPVPNPSISVTTTYVFDSPDGVNLILTNFAKKPTRTVLLTGTAATYTTPIGATRINVREVGGGGSGATSGANGTNTTFGALTAGGGTGAGTQGGAGGGGGTAIGGDVNVPGGNGSGAAQNNQAGTALSGVAGGNSALGGGGGGGGVSATGTAGSAGSGGGGGSDGVGTATNGRPSGGAGGYVEKLIISPAATYLYTVGVGGASGTGGQAGGSGVIIVDEYYD